MKQKYQVNLKSSIAPIDVYLVSKEQEKSSSAETAVGTEEDDESLGTKPKKLKKSMNKFLYFMECRLT